MARNYVGLSRAIHSSALTERGLGAGDPQGSSSRVGKENASWSRVDLTGLSVTPTVAGTVIEVDVPHDLKQVPTVVSLESFENSTTAGTFITATGVKQDRWSHGHAIVSVRLQAGSLNGCVATLKVTGR